MRIGFFTPRTLEPLHPRLLLFEEFFRRKGFFIKFFNESMFGKSIGSRINWLFLWFIDLYAVSRCKPYVKDFDIVFITDLKYLSLARYAKRLNKIVIYDTIDHNVYLRFYQLVQKIPIIKAFRRIVIPWFKKVEKHYAFNFCDEIIVNSDSLATYFNNRAHVLYYSSPLERISIVNLPVNPPALLYLGAFSREKGATEVIHFQKKLSIPLFVYGNVSEPSLKKELEKLDQVSYIPKVSVSELEKKLTGLLSKYYLIGFSMIKAVHYSYKVQEANKDIDYLALGIPLIGNYRLPTKEKIEAGCGIFFDDTKLTQKIYDVNVRESLSRKTRLYYDQKYSLRLFNQKLESIVGKYLKEGEKF